MSNLELGSEALSDTFPIEEWEVDLPPHDFADRVMARIDSIATPRPRTRSWRLAGGAALAFAIAAAVLLHWRTTPSRGEEIAKERIEVWIGSRALAVLEPDAHVSWNGDDLVQSRGEIFYRVEPGKRFSVHTPAGDVEVKGTCFSVKVQERAASAVTFVAVDEGIVSLSRAGTSLELRAGERAQAGEDGVKRLGSGVSSRFDEVVPKEDDVLLAANEDLVRQVSGYRTRLESISARKKELEDALAKSEQRLAATQDGGRVPWSDFDPSPERWKELAKEGTVKYDIPCPNREAWVPSAEVLRNLGLGSEDGEALKNAYARSHERVAAVIKPLCVAAVGAETAGQMSASTCVSLILATEDDRDTRGVSVAIKHVAEIRAGLRAMPRDGEAIHPVMKALLATTGEGEMFERDLAQSLGPDEARRVRFSEDVCRLQHMFIGSKK